jgi:Flp pilus assembly protein TadD
MLTLNRATAGVCALILLQAALLGCRAGAPRQDSFATATDRPPTPRTLLMMSRLLSENGRHGQAEYVLSRVIDQNPEFLPAYVELADIQISQERHNEATQTLRQAHELAPHDPVIANNLGVLLLRNRETEAAGAAFEAAVNADPDEARYRANLAVSLGMRGMYEEAFRVYTTAVPPAAAYWNVGVIAESRQDMAMADEYFARSQNAGDEESGPEDATATVSVPVE